jgi:acetyltransferase-like isoleucine patch superfamily enzyme
MFALQILITNIDHNYQSIGIPILQQGYTTRETSIGKHCFIRHNAVIQVGMKLGNQVIIRASFVVNKGSYPSNCILVGVPAKIVKKYNQQEE